MLKNINQYFGFAGAILIVTGLIYSPAFQSIGVALIFLHFFFNIRKLDFRSLLSNKKNWLTFGLLTMYLISIISGVYSHNFHEYMQKMQVKLPFLLLPIGFLSPNILNRKQFQIVLFIFILSVFSAGVVTLGNYFLNFKAVNEQITHSKPIHVFFALEKTGNEVKEGHSRISHIYYSVLLAFAFWAVLFLLNENFLKKAARYLLIFLGFIILVLLHFISARTGIFAFYGASIAGLMWLLFFKRKLLLGASLAGSLIILFAAAYFLVPSWKYRTMNTKEDLSHTMKGENINHWSIGMRGEAIKTGMKIYSRNPILGVGEGNLQDEMEKQYIADKTELISENHKLPHNQFIQNLLTTGIPGFLILFIIFILPFFVAPAHKHLLFLTFLVICFISFQVESVLERQVGITFFTFFYLAIPLYFAQRKADAKIT